MRTVGVVTTSRADYGIYLPILRQIQADSELKLHLIVAGMHLSPEFGSTVSFIEDDGFDIGDQVEMLVSSDSPEGISESMGLGTIGFARAYGRFRPDILVVLGDRFEMHSAAVAALPFNIPVAHIHGGEVTEGAIDNSFRHSMTKLSHLHFVATEEYRDRVVQMGEEPWRVTVSGAPGLDYIGTLDLLQPHEMSDKYGLNLDSPPLLVTFHPVTLELESTEWQVQELLAALEACEVPAVITQSNADTKGRMVTRMMRNYAEGHDNTQFVENLGPLGYFSLMASGAAMVGNSSSGIIEAPSFRLPVVNIGTRQDGRVRGRNVIDVGQHREEILAGIRQAFKPAFREQIKDSVNPYGDGNSANRIVARLKEIPLGDGLLRKRFHDVGVTSSDHVANGATVGT